MPRKETYSGPLSAQAQQDLVSEGIENFELPKSMVMKIAKSSVGLARHQIVAELVHKTMMIDTRQCEIAEGDSAFACKRFDGVH